MSDIQAKVSPPARGWWRIPVRFITVVLLASAVAWGLNRFSLTMDARGRPAGFTRGLLQGALMPCALPHLAVGRDVAIYSENNTGVTYKLGYTAGVNACGAIFFGIFFWRLNRWRKRLVKKR